MNDHFLMSQTPIDEICGTIDPRRPFKWLEFCGASRTVGFTPRFEKNDRVITSLFTARTKFVDSSSITLNFSWEIHIFTKFVKNLTSTDYTFISI